MEERQRGRYERHAREGGDRDDDRTAERHPREQGVAEDQDAEKGHGHGETRHENRAAGTRDGTGDELVEGRGGIGGALLAEAQHHEEAVVDGEAEAQDRHDVHRELVDVDDAGEQTQDRECRGDRGERGDDGDEGDAQRAEREGEQHDEDEDRHALADRRVGGRPIDEGLLRQERSADEDLGRVDRVEEVGDDGCRGDGLVAGETEGEFDDHQGRAAVVTDRPARGVGVGDLGDPGDGADRGHDGGRAVAQRRGEEVLAADDGGDDLALGVEGVEAFVGAQRLAAGRGVGDRDGAVEGVAREGPADHDEHGPGEEDEKTVPTHAAAEGGEHGDLWDMRERPRRRT